MPLAWRLFYISYENGRTKVGVRCLCSAALLPFSFVVSGFVAGCCSTQLLVGNKPSLSLPLPLSLCTESSQLCAHKRAILFLDLFPDDVFIFSFTCRRRCVFFLPSTSFNFRGSYASSGRKSYNEIINSSSLCCVNIFEIHCLCAGRERCHVLYLCI